MGPTAEPLERLLRAGRALERAGSYLFFRCGARFCNPLVKRERTALENSGALPGAAVLEVIERDLVLRVPELPAGIYAPVPLERALASGRPAEDALAEFRYEMIEVDAGQTWRWQGRPVAPRLRAFFLEHTAWEPDIDRHFFEYRVSDDWYDKSYFRGHSPLLASGVTVLTDGRTRVRLNNGHDDTLVLDTFRLDESERLWCTTTRHGPVMISETDRLRLVQGVDSDLRSLRIAGARWPLRWPGGGAAPSEE